MEKYNILFLDFDGVINNSDPNQENDHLLIPDDFNQYNPKLVGNIKTIIHEFNFKLVISSTWRKDYSIQKMNHILNDIMKLDCTILDYTTKEFLDRGLQISKWLSEEKYDMNFYVVIDDDTDAAYNHESNFFQVDTFTGFDDLHKIKFNKFMENLIYDFSKRFKN